MRLDLSSRVRIGVSRTGAVGFSSGIPYNADPRSWSATQAYDPYYYPDDAPFINYTKVSGNPARCHAYLVDTSQLPTDLKSARTTPACSWIAPDDYYDAKRPAGEGHGFRYRYELCTG